MLSNILLHSQALNVEYRKVTGKVLDTLQWQIMNLILIAAALLKTILEYKSKALLIQSPKEKVKTRNDQHDFVTKVLASHTH